MPDADKELSFREHMAREDAAAAGSKRETPPEMRRPRRREAEGQRRPSLRQPVVEEGWGGVRYSFRRAGMQEREFQRLRRGGYEVGDAFLDLHGATVAGAQDKVRGFLRDCLVRGRRRARIVHGKGARSPDGIPALREPLREQLKRDADVLAVWTASPREGGSGALNVYLRGR
ncbi:MAG: Smr/MutS family protein [Gammaproteobacteria bacterium]|nr:Smr/MutS family protein [Gammaproteobacteria bacterium]